MSLEINADRILRPVEDDETFEVQANVERELSLLKGKSAEKYCAEKTAEAKEMIASCINALPTEIVLTKGAVDGNARVIRRFAVISGYVSTELEPPATRYLLEKAGNLGPKGRYVFADGRGLVAPSTFFDQMTASGAFLGLASLVSWQTGIVQNIRPEARGTQLMKGVFHLDASLALGRMPINSRDYNADFINGDASFFGGPTGIGFLCMRQRVRKRFRRLAMEIDVPLDPEDLGRAFGMATALKRRHEKMFVNGSHLNQLVDAFKKAVRARRLLGEVGFVGEHVLTLPGFALTLFPNLSGACVCEALAKKGIQATPLALVAKNGHAVPLMRMMNISSAAAAGAVRFCFGSDMSIEDVCRIAKAIPSR